MKYKYTRKEIAEFIINLFEDDAPKSTKIIIRDLLALKGPTCGYCGKELLKGFEHICLKRQEAYEVFAKELTPESETTNKVFYETGELIKTINSLLKAVK